MPGRIHVVRAAAPILLQDRGRAGWATLGIPTSGAFDSLSAALAQRLVGNDESHAGLEITLGSVQLRVDTTVTAAVAGPDVAIWVGGTAVAVHEVFSWPAGAELRMDVPTSGLRHYLAVRGGFACERVLGSASHDVLSQLGSAPLHPGDAVALAGLPAGPPTLTHAPIGAGEEGVLRIRLGPRDAWFTPQAVAALTSQPYTVAPQSNRIGLRLQGVALDRRLPGELPSEPLQRGALQVPPNGQPIIMGPDHPTTGGYPVIAAVIAQDWPKCGQLRPGDVVRFALDRH
jgi:biotin-dependent carboxylase-like uncharacterized protein